MDFDSNGQAFASKVGKLDLNDELKSGENPLESRTPVMAGRILNNQAFACKSPFFSSAHRNVAPDATPIVQNVQRVHQPNRQVQVGMFVMNKLSDVADSNKLSPSPNKPSLPEIKLDRNTAPASNRP